jgi:dipeptidyl aminopeptidase/acylaminoacyl peptidase
MQISDLGRLRLPSDPALSPDGRQVVVAVSRIDLAADTYRSELWTAPTDGSAPLRRLTNGPRDMQPVYSPDGRWLAFLRAETGGKPELHVLPAHGGESRRLTEHPLGVDAPAWAPDSATIAYSARVPEPGRYGTDPDITPEKEPPRRITHRKYRLDNVGFTIDRRAQIFTVDITDGATPVQLTDGDYDHVDPTWSPDGRWLAFASGRHETRHTDEISDIHIVAREGGEVRTITDTSLPASRPLFVSDDQLVFLADSHPDFVGRNVRMWLIDVAGGAPKPLTDTERWHLDSYGSGSRQPRLLDGDGVVTLNQHRGSLQLVRVPLDGGEPTVLVDGPRQVLGASRAGGVTATVVSTDVSAGELVILDGEGERTLSRFGAELSEATSVAPMHELHATAPDGYPVHGWLVKPEGAGPFPVLLAIHGGPFAAYGWHLLDEAQIYAGAGYAVVLGNPRGSSGYGEAHGRAIVGDMGNLDRIDLLTLLDAALAEPGLDADRVGVMGGSYGGFMTTWLAGTERRFRAAISERAVNVWDSFIGSSDIGWVFPEAYCGSDPERLAAQSPLTYADGISIPMLIIHSEEDWRCPLEQAQRLFERLQRNGVPSEMLLFPGEGHELSRSGLPSHRVARFEAIIEWWRRHLGHSGSSDASVAGSSDASSAGALPT